MQRFNVVTFARLAILAAALPWSGLAQQPEDGDAPPRVARIRRLARPGRRMLEKTPEFRTVAGRPARRPRDWAHIEVTLDTAPEWIDELTVSFYVMARGGEEDQFSFYQTSVRYMDIPRGQEHRGSVFLLPSAVERYGLPVALGVEIIYEGQTVAEESASSISALGDAWWREARIVDSPNVTKREGYLLDRSRTPFALVNWDEYLIVR